MLQYPQSTNKMLGFIPDILSRCSSKVEIPNGAVDALLTSGAKCGGTVLGVAKLPLCPTGVLISAAATVFFVCISLSLSVCYVMYLCVC